MSDTDVRDLRKETIEQRKLIATLARLLREREFNLELACCDECSPEEYNTRSHKPGCELAAALAASEDLVKP